MHVSGHFQQPALTDKSANKKTPRRKPRVQVQQHSIAKSSPKSPIVRQSKDSEVLSSPKLNNSTRRNYFRRDQMNKALVSSMRKSDANSPPLQVMTEEDRKLKNISKHD